MTRSDGGVVAASRAASLCVVDLLEPRILLSSSPEGLSPATIRHAYGIDAVTFGEIPGDGTGQTIAIVSIYNAPRIRADLAAFDAQFGLPAPPKFTVIGQDGTANLPGTDPQGPGDTAWAVETSLDVEWAHAIAPGAKILLVEARSTSDADLFAAIDTARRYPGVCSVSLSIAWGESSSETHFDSFFTTPAGHNGVTFVMPTGDDGAGPLYPAASPNVLSVGGTTLRTDYLGNYVSETAWGNGDASDEYGGTGGGISTYERQPAYQKGVVTQSSTMRTLPDVAFDADPDTGVPVYDSWDFGASSPWGQFGGTSFAAPVWAGLIAIADQGRALEGLGTLDGFTQTLPMLYALPSLDFHDITSGNNGGEAGPGYDLLTGLGTPVVDRLVKGLIPPQAVNDTANIHNDDNVDLIDVLANDHDRNGAILMITRASGAAHGTLGLVDNQVQYQLTDLSARSDSFTYTIADEFGGTATATVNLVVTFDDPELTIGDGQVAKTLAYTDPDGTLVTVSVSKGTASLKLAGIEVAILGTKALTLTGSVQLSRILLSGTTTASSLKITTKGGSDGLATVGEITGSSPIGKLSGPGVDLQGAGITMTGSGVISSLTLHDIDADVAMPGAGPAAGLKITARWIDAADITLGWRLASLTASQWESGGLVATSAGTVIINGDPKRSLPGNLGADITLSAADVKGTAIRTLRVAGTLDAALVASAGNVGTITAGAWTGGSLLAASAASVIVKGSLTGTSLTLTRPPSTTGRAVNALGRLSVTGRMVASTVRSAGNIGAVSVGTMESSAVYAGLVLATPPMPLARDDFAAGADSALPQIKSITVSGVVGQAYSFLDSTLAAWNIGAVRLKDVQFDTPDIDAWFGISANHLGSYQRRSGKVLSYTWKPTALVTWPVDDLLDFHITQIAAAPV